MENPEQNKQMTRSLPNRRDLRLCLPGTWPRTDCLVMGLLSLDPPQMLSAYRLAGSDRRNRGVGPRREATATGYWCWFGQAETMALRSRSSPGENVWLGGHAGSLGSADPLEDPRCPPQVSRRVGGAACGCLHRDRFRSRRRLLRAAGDARLSGLARQWSAAAADLTCGRAGCIWLS
jgi:hypothetical protein